VLFRTADGQDNGPLALAGLQLDIFPGQVLQPNFFFQFLSPHKNDLRLIEPSFLENLNGMSSSMCHKRGS
jgi:hypothetical protein